MVQSREEKAITHERIVDVAAKRFREVGLNGIGVADLMKEAGRTVGGFYKHFDTREQLVEEAIAYAFSLRRENLEREFSDGQFGFHEMLNRYLSKSHRDQPGAGCAIGALLNDVARANAPIRELYTEQIRQEISRLMASSGRKSSSKKRKHAVLALCAMVGAIGLARAVIDEELSTEFLDIRETMVKLLEL